MLHLFCCSREQSALFERVPPPTNTAITAQDANNRRFICLHKDTRCREHNTDIDTHTVAQAGTHLCPSRAFAEPTQYCHIFACHMGPETDKAVLSTTD